MKTLILVASLVCNQAFAASPQLQQLSRTQVGARIMQELGVNVATADLSAALTAKYGAQQTTVILAAITQFNTQAAGSQNIDGLVNSIFKVSPQGIFNVADLSNSTRIGMAQTPAALSKASVGKINAFSDVLLTKILESESDKNTFITGPAMVSALVMLVNGTTGPAKIELLKSLGYAESELNDLNAAASAMLAQFNQKSAGVETSMANAFFADSSLPIQPAYRNLVETRFKATSANLSFKDQPEAAAGVINSWAKDNTGGMIPSIITPDAVSDLAALLATAVYFKGNWATEFNPQQTRTEDFTLANGQRVPVDMMNATLTFEAFADHGTPYVIARLPYVGQTAAMYLVLPTVDWNTMKPSISVDQAMILALKSGNLAAIQAKGKGVNTFTNEDVKLPKFAMKYSNAELKNIFEALGVNGVFNAGSLTGISVDPRLKVSYIRMDTALEVDEKGSKAAGVASIGMGLESMKMNLFEFNRPFGIVIRDDSTGVNLFSGVVRNPKL